MVTKSLCNEVVEVNMFLNATTATPFLARFPGQEKGGLHKCIARFITYSSPGRADTWFPSLPRKECTSVRYVINKFSRMDGLPNFFTHSAPLARFARRSSAIIIRDMKIVYGESLWPGTQTVNPLLTRGVVGWVAGHFAFAASSRVMGWNTSNLF